MYIVEFQKGPIMDKDLRRFGSYQALVYKETGLETIVVVISLDAREDSDELFGFGGFFDGNSDEESLKIEYGFTPHVKSLTALDLSLNLNIMDRIIENNEKPTEYELAILFAIPFMTDDDEKRKELIFETARMASKLNIDDSDLFMGIVMNQVLLAQTVLDVDEFLRFMEVMKMSDEDFAYKIGMYIKQAKEDLARKDGKEEGREEGENVTRRLLVRNMLAEGIAPAMIARISGLTEEEVSALAKE